MLQPGGELDLTKKSVHAFPPTKLGTHDLHRDRPFMAEIPREIHRGHAASTDLTLEHIAIGQLVTKTRRDVAHFCKCTRFGGLRTPCGNPHIYSTILSRRAEWSRETTVRKFMRTAPGGSFPSRRGRLMSSAPRP